MCSAFQGVLCSSFIYSVGHRPSDWYVFLFFFNPDVECPRKKKKKMSSSAPSQKGDLKTTDEDSSGKQQSGMSV